MFGQSADGTPGTDASSMTAYVSPALPDRSPTIQGDLTSPRAPTASDSSASKSSRASTDSGSGGTGPDTVRPDTALDGVDPTGCCSFRFERLRRCRRGPSVVVIDLTRSLQRAADVV